MIDFSKHLNNAQLEAVTTLNGPLLVIAGAGSGKTRVIEYRVLSLILNNVKPSSILLLTFTRKAAQQMLNRASAHDLRCKNVEGGTFHSFAYKILKRYSSLIGFDSFSILDDSDTEEAINSCLSKLGELRKEKTFPKKDTLKNIISMSRNKGLSIERVLYREYPNFMQYADKIEGIKKDYMRYKLEKGYFDYDDLLIYLRDLLEKNEEIRNNLSEKYIYIMVDEYQDTNKLQSDIVCLLAKNHKNIMIVGDDAQSIYGFRGASHENILEFPKKFNNCRIIKLEENYRSSQSILDVANEVLKNMSIKYSKYLFSAEKKSGEKPNLLIFNDNYEEAEWITRRIVEFMEQGIPLNNQAILFRSSYISIPLQAELSKSNIPYQVFGGLRFYESAHVKDLISYLKIIYNQKDELAWNRLLLLIEGIGNKTSERLLSEIKFCPDMGKVIQNVFNNPGKEHKYSRALKELGMVLEEIKDESLSIEDKFKIILEFYQETLKEKFDDWNDRLKDLEVLRDISARYDSLGDFLADFAIDPPEKNKTNSGLVLSTIHSAKGLEWDCVYMIGLMDGILPVSFALNDDVGIEEEHRLFYVGITRAKRRLFLSLHQEGIGNSMNQYARISRFVDAPGVLSKLNKIYSPYATPMY